MTHSDSTWPIQRWLDSIQQAVLTCKSWKCWATLCVHTCAGWRKTLCMKVLRSSRKPVFASVCVNSCSAGWWEALLVERGEHCERCKISVPVVISAGVTGWKLPRTGWRSITVEGCGLLCVLLRLHSVWQKETTKKHRRHVVREAQYKREPQLGASKEADVVRAGSKTQCKQI